METTEISDAEKLQIDTNGHHNHQSTEQSCDHTTSTANLNYCMRKKSRCRISKSGQMSTFPGTTARNIKLSTLPKTILRVCTQQYATIKLRPPIARSQPPIHVRAAEKHKGLGTRSHGVVSGVCITAIISQMVGSRQRIQSSERSGCIITQCYELGYCTCDSVCRSNKHKGRRSECHELVKQDQAGC